MLVSYFGAPLCCPRCGNVSRDDTSTGMDNQLSTDERRVLFKVGDQVPFQADDYRESFFAVRPQTGDATILHHWHCPSCHALHWASIVIGDSVIRSISTVPFDALELERANYASQEIGEEFSRVTGRSMYERGRPVRDWVLQLVAALSAGPPARDDMTVVTPQQSAAHGLSPLRIEVDLKAARMIAAPFPDTGMYMSASGPPGSPESFAIFSARPTTVQPASIASAAHESLVNGWIQPVAIGEPTTTRIAGEEQPALAITTGRGVTLTSWCATIVAAGDIGALVMFGLAASATRMPTARAIAEHPSLSAIARTLRISS
jgi:hypothetical protein